jgi:D-alanine-D-alanine ligase
MRVLLLTGPGGDAQGWGDMKVTRAVADAAGAVGHPARTAFVETERDFLRVIDAGGFDIVWSALYYITPNEKFIGRGEGGMWVADVLDSKGIPYIGSNSQTMKDMIDKFKTHETLASRGVAVPAHYLVRSADDVSMVRYPAFVKPMGESRSVGINDDSVVNDADELRRQVAWIEREFQQAALVEDFMPGDEFTTLILGNGATRQCLPGLVSVEPKYYGKHKVLRADLRGVGLTKISKPDSRGGEAAALAMQAADAMRCLDHVRIDIKTDASGALRVMEVNGIPGLKPLKSWAPQIYTLYFGSQEGEMADYCSLIRAIIEAGGERYGLR